MKEKWVALSCKSADINALSAKYGVSPLIIRLIMNRGVDEADIGLYIHGTMTDLSPAGDMKGLKKAADIIQDRKGSAIAIVSDYDCDGIFAGMILYTGLKMLGLEPHIYTPDRVTEGYGINRRIVDEIYGSGIRNIITCDNGIAAFDEIKYAKELGMTVIITDHHEIPYREVDGSEEGSDGRQYIIPEADAVLDPKQKDCNYAYDSLCGAGVAYRLIDYLYDMNDIAPENKDILIQYAAIATVADVMDLNGENRIIVREGLKLLSKTTNVGLSAILEAVGANDTALSTYHIGFVIGPCFNAAGRIQNAEAAFDLLRCNDPVKAAELARNLKELNDERKQITEEAAGYCMQLADEGAYDNDKVVVIYVPECHESVVGIVAGRVKERLCKPVIVFTDGEGGMYKGSGRSIEAYNMFEELSAVKDLFEEFGGHAMAAGITMKSVNIDELRKRLGQNSTLTEDDFVSKVEIDMQLPFGYISEEMIGELHILEPCGKANTKPLFAIAHASVKSARIFGKTGNVLKLRLADANGCEVSAVLFNRTEEFLDMIRADFGEDQLNNMLHGAKNNIDIAVTYYPDINEYNGFRNIEIVIRNFNRIV